MLFFPVGRYARAGRPVGSTPLRVRTAFFEAVMFPLHCYPHIVLLLPRVSFPLSPSAHKEFAVDSQTLILPANFTRMPREARDALDQLIFIKHGEAQT